ncbi:unnamed protein product, partial [Ixodes hexagonus]
GKKRGGGATRRRVLAAAEEAVCVVFWGSEDRPWRWIQKWISRPKAQRVIREKATGYPPSLTHLAAKRLSASPTRRSGSVAAAHADRRLTGPREQRALA